MSVWTFVEDDEHPIPRDSNYRIVEATTSYLVPGGQGITHHAVSAALDPGKYRLVIWKPNPRKLRETMKWVKEFYHECTPAEYEKLKDPELRMTKGRMVSNGLQYMCQLTDCDVITTSKLAAALHEAEHTGVKLLGSREEPVRKVAQDFNANEDKRQSTMAQVRKQALEGG